MEATPYFFVALSLLCSVNCFPWTDFLKDSNFQHPKTWCTHDPLGAMALSPPAGLHDLLNTTAWKSAVGRSSAHSFPGRKVYSTSFDFGRYRRDVADSPASSERFKLTDGREETAGEPAVGEANAAGSKLKEGTGRSGHQLDIPSPTRPHNLERGGNKKQRAYSTIFPSAFISKVGRDVSTGTSQDDAWEDVALVSKPYHTTGVSVSKKASGKGGRYAAGLTKRKKGPAAAFSFAATANKSRSMEDTERGKRPAARSGFGSGEWTRSNGKERLESATLGFNSTKNQASWKKERGRVGGIQRVAISELLVPDPDQPRSPSPSGLYTASFTGEIPLPGEMKLNAAGNVVSLAVLKQRVNKEGGGSQSDREATGRSGRPGNLDVVDGAEDNVTQKAAAGEVTASQSPKTEAQEREEAAEAAEEPTAKKTAGSVANGEGAAAAAPGQEEGSAIPPQARATATHIAVHEATGEKSGGEAGEEEQMVSRYAEGDRHSDTKSPLCGAWQTIPDFPSIPYDASSFPEGLADLTSVLGKKGVQAVNVPATRSERINDQPLDEYVNAAAAALTNTNIPRSPTCQWLPRHGLYVVERRTYTENPNLVDVERLEFVWNADCVPERLSRRWIYSGTWESTNMAKGKDGALAQLSVKIKWLRVQVHSDLNALNHLQEKKTAQKNEDDSLSEKNSCPEHEAWLNPSKTLPLDILDLCVRPQKQLYVSVPSRELMVMPQRVAVSHKVIPPGDRRARLRQGNFDSQDESGEAETQTEEMHEWEDANVKLCMAKMNEYEAGWDKFLSKQNIWAKQLCTWSLLKQSCPVPPKETEHLEEEGEADKKNGEKKQDSAVPACPMPPLKHTIYRSEDVDFLVLPQFPFGKDADKITFRKVNGCELYERIQKSLEEEHAR